MHEKKVCKHGTVVSNCRCSSPQKVTTVVPCPEYCKKDSKTTTPKN